MHKEDLTFFAKKTHHFWHWYVYMALNCLFDILCHLPRKIPFLAMVSLRRWLAFWYSLPRNLTIFDLLQWCFFIKIKSKRKPTFLFTKTQMTTDPPLCVYQLEYHLFICEEFNFVISVKQNTTYYKFPIVVLFKVQK